jgi:hypothetical protein
VRNGRGQLIVGAGAVHHGDLTAGALFAFANAVIRARPEWVDLGHRLNRSADISYRRVAEARFDASEVGDTVPIRILERTRIDRVDHRVLPPGIGSPRCRSKKADQQCLRSALLHAPKDAIFAGRTAAPPRGGAATLIASVPFERPKEAFEFRREFPVCRHGRLRRHRICTGTGMATPRSASAASISMLAPACRVIGRCPVRRRSPLRRLERSSVRN